MLSTLRRAPLAPGLRVRTPRALPLPLLARAPQTRAYASKPPQGVVSYAMKLMSDPVIETIALASRIARILVGSVLVVGSVTFVVWEGAHQYVEHVAMPAAAHVEEVSAHDTYGWERDDVTHHLGIAPGTDARLGIFGRHIVRSAWMAEHWGGGIAPQAIFGLAPRGMPVHRAADFEAHQGLRLAERFLTTALRVADARNVRVEEFSDTGAPLDSTAATLETWLAAVRMRLGTPAALGAAGLAYEKLYDAYATQPHAEAVCDVLAMRLGTLQGQLGHLDESLAWFGRALHDDTRALVDAALAQKAAPRSPLAMRTAVRTLEALSRVYVHASSLSDTPRDALHNALRVQLAALALAQGEHARPGVGADAELQRAWAHETEAEMGVQIAETLYALHQHPAPRRWFAWLKRDKVLDARPPRTDAVLPATAGAYAASRAWLAFAVERAAHVQSALAAEAATPSYAALSRQHAATRLGERARLTESEAQLLLRALARHEVP